jgi:2-hydroxychromene-2-carboxylate isomerase
VSPAIAKPYVDFYFDVVCPYAYLAHTQIEALCRRTEVGLRWRPILLGGLFREVRGVGEGPMASMSAARARLNLLDMQRWAEHWDVPLVMPASHPNRTVLAMRTIVASDDVPRAAKALFAAYWAQGRDLSDPAEVSRALDGADFDGNALVAAAERPDIKLRLRERTDEAVAAGAFGVPSFVVRGTDADSDLLWGQDRLQFLEAAMRRAS